MKHLKQHWSAQPLSLLLSVLMALPVLALFLLRAPAAQAQGLAGRQPNWAVLDFANPSGYGSTDVGRLAADSFVVELAKLNRYTVLPRQDLLNGIQTNNLTPPLNLTSIERLGLSLGVDAVVAGEIASVSFSRDRRQAKVDLVVRVIDPRSGLLLNGALAEGYSNPRPIPVSDEEQLVNEAFGNAAFNAVKQISKFTPAVATVLIGRDTNSVTLNKGTRDGLYNGLDMIVTRNGIIKGRIRVSDASNNDANATITDLGGGILPEDRATALYTLPAYTINRSTGTFNTTDNAAVAVDNPSAGTRRTPFSGVGGILVALLAAVLLVSATRNGHSDSSLGGASVSGPLAISGRAFDLGGPSSAAPTVGFTATTYTPVVVRITANTGNITYTNFLEYHVYRSDAPISLSSFNALPGKFSTTQIVYTNPVNTNGTNTNGNTAGTNTTGTTGGVLGIAAFGQVPLFAQGGHANLQVFDDFNEKTSIVASKPDPSDSGTLVTVYGAGVPLASTTIPTTTTPIPGTGLQFGQRIAYSIEGLYIQPATTNTGNSTGVINPGTTGNNGQNTSGNTAGQNTAGQTTAGQNTNGTNTAGTTYGHSATLQLTGLRRTNYVTYIEPVRPFGNSVTGTGTSNVNVTIPATRGANDYILQIGTDPTFSNSRTYSAAAGAYNAPLSDPTNQGATSATGLSVANGTAVVFNNINLANDFPNGTAFFYRIGARDASNNNQAGFDNPYVFSDPLTLTITGISAALLKARLSGPSTIHRPRN